MPESLLEVLADYIGLDRQEALLPRLYGVLLLGEPLRAVYIVGLALILVGVMLAGRSGSKRRKAAVAVAATPVD